MRSLAAGVLLLASCASAAVRQESGAARAPPAPRARQEWRHWEAFRKGFISPDGRVIDRAPRGDGRTTSEGQAYGLFFALVAGDRDTFDLLRGWTLENLQRGDPGALPAWLWGSDAKRGAYGVLDPNPASDADLWLAYCLLEGARLWDAPRLREEARALLVAVAAREVQEVASAGPVLLPGPEGFRLEGGALRLNPSYLPPQVLRALALSGVRGPWARLEDTSLRLVAAACGQHGLAPDWVRLSDGALLPDAQDANRGAYDAIRVILWAGMLPAEAPGRARLLSACGGLVRLIGPGGDVPEAVDVATGRAGPRAGPPGFQGALLPALLATGETLLAAMLRERLAAVESDGLFGAPAAYYDQALLLFALGHVEGRFRFSPEGALLPSWSAP